MSKGATRDKYRMNKGGALNGQPGDARKRAARNALRNAHLRAWRTRFVSSSSATVCSLVACSGPSSLSYLPRLVVHGRPELRAQDVGRLDGVLERAGRPDLESVLAHVAVDAVARVSGCLAPGGQGEHNALDIGGGGAGSAVGAAQVDAHVAAAALDAEVRGALLQRRLVRRIGRVEHEPTLSVSSG